MRGMNIKRGYLDFTEENNRYWESTDGVEKYLLNDQDIVISMDGSLVGSSYGMVSKKDLPLLLVQRVTRIRTNQANIRYVYHYIASGRFTEYVHKKKTAGAIPHISLKDISNFEVPLPSLEIQKRLVEVLDNFDALCTDLNIGLPAEIEARKKQYEFYRDQLLTFAAQGETILTDRQTDRQTDEYSALIRLCQYVFGYAFVELSLAANVFRGEYITKKDSIPGDIPVILGGQEPAYYIDRSNHIGEAVVVARSGASAGFVSYWNEPIFVTDCFGFETKQSLMIPKFLYYALKNMEQTLNDMKRGAGVPHLSGEVLLSIPLCVPTIREQKRIVSTLDRFDTLCTDLSAGLPAEIEARQKQYEYYRDKLLTFTPAD